VSEKNHKILISACLLGQAVRYDGQANETHDPVLDHWQKAGRLVPLCPEVIGGLPVPRPAAEMFACNACDVLNGHGYVKTKAGDDVSRFFLLGAQQALSLCHQQNIRVAILKENSPSCGSTQVYDGKFSGKLNAGSGVTTELLRANGITVFSEHEIEAAEKYTKTSL